MSTDINKRLAQLRSRRKGTGSIAMDSMERADSVLGNLITEDAWSTPEAWETRAGPNQPSTRYALGAMAPVGAKYTQVSKDAADKVAKQLRERLAKANIKAEFKLQGSVPLDVHIKKVSDVDLLAIRTGFRTYSVTGVGAQRGEYHANTTKTSEQVLSELRAQIEVDLPTAFPAATVDKKGAKAVKISGGTLPRHVDVVPAHWFDNDDYQASGRDEVRSVTIYNKTTNETIDNLPFLHISRIGDRCDRLTGGGLRKSIRLCKSVKADSDRGIELSSYDIGAIMYHADMAALRGVQGIPNDLAVLAETQRHLDWLWNNKDAGGALLVPDGSRLIFDDPKKWDWLAWLSLDIDELLSEVYSENGATLIASLRTPAHMRELLRRVSV